MKILTILGTRPEIIRLCRVIEKVDKLCDHVLVHTGQNFDPALSDIFFDQLNVRRPDHFLGIRAANAGQQIAKILAASEEVITLEKPDRLLILGDTNSSLSAIIAKRLGIPVYHMEAGNRCYDDRVPEEVNRRIIDHSSDVLMPYTGQSRRNLLREGISGERIFVTGNPINEVMRHYEDRMQDSRVLEELNLAQKRYFLVTMHRAENVDVEERLKKLTAGLELVQKKHGLPMIISTHPHTRNKMDSFGIGLQDSELLFMPPFGFFDFISLERNAFCVLSDSGTVQEECCLLGVPNVTLRDVTERPETIECGSNILSGAEPDSILRCVETAINRTGSWSPPSEYMMTNVSETVTKILLGYRHLP